MAQTRADLNNALDSIIDQSNNLNAAAGALKQDIVDAKARVDALPVADDFTVEVDKLTTAAGILAAAQTNIADGRSVAQTIAS